MDFIILPCPNCGVKNRVKTYHSNKIPVCAKCKTKLVESGEHETLSKYDQSLKDFGNLPDLDLG